MSGILKPPQTFAFCSLPQLLARYELALPAIEPPRELEAGAGAEVKVEDVAVANTRAKLIPVVVTTSRPDIDPGKVVALICVLGFVVDGATGRAGARHRLLRSVIFFFAMIAQPQAPPHHEAATVKTPVNKVCQEDFEQVNFRDTNVHAARTLGALLTTNTTNK